MRRWQSSAVCARIDVLVEGAAQLQPPTQLTDTTPMPSYETRCSMFTVTTLAMPPSTDMRESTAKWSVAPGTRASTPGDFFWCAGLVASDV